MKQNKIAPLNGAYIQREWKKITLPRAYPYSFYYTTDRVYLASLRI